MIKEEIIEMVIEAGGYRTKKYPEEWRLDDDDLRRFAKRITQKYREAIEKRVMELDEPIATRVNVINKAIRTGEKNE